MENIYIFPLQRHLKKDYNLEIFIGEMNHMVPNLQCVVDKCSVYRFR